MSTVHSAVDSLDPFSSMFFFFLPKSTKSGHDAVSILIHKSAHGELAVQLPLRCSMKHSKWKNRLANEKFVFVSSAT